MNNIININNNNNNNDIIIIINVWNINEILMCVLLLMIMCYYY